MKSAIRSQELATTGSSPTVGKAMVLPLKVIPTCWGSLQSFTLIIHYVFGSTKVSARKK